MPLPARPTASLTPRARQWQTADSSHKGGTPADLMRRGEPLSIVAVVIRGRVGIIELYALNEDGTRAPRL